MPFADDQQPYTVEQAEEDIAILRGQITTLTEILSHVNTLPGGPPAGAPATGYQQYGDGPGFPQIISSADSGLYDLASVSQYVTSSSGQNIVSATPATVGGMVFALAPSQAYDFEAMIHYNPAASGNPTFSWLTTTTFTIFTASFVEINLNLNSGSGATFGNSMLANTKSSSFAGSVFGAASRLLAIRGSLLNSNNANTIALQSGSATAATFNINGGSRMTVWPRVAGGGL